MSLPIAREGWPFILGSGALLFLLLLLRAGPAAIIALLLTLFIAWFFRDPERTVTSDDALIVSAGDGRVIEVTALSGGGTKIGVFLSIFDVHVNRIPLSGEPSWRAWRGVCGVPSGTAGGGSGRCRTRIPLASRKRLC